MRAEEIADEVRELITVGGWNWLLYIKNLDFRDLILEVLALFDFDRSHNDYKQDDAIQFRAFGQYYSMSLTQFSVTLGLYARNSSTWSTLSYHPITHPEWPNRVFRMLCGHVEYERDPRRLPYSFAGS